MPALAMAGQLVALIVLTPLARFNNCSVAGLLGLLNWMSSTSPGLLPVRLVFALSVTVAMPTPPLPVPMLK